MTETHVANETRAATARARATTAVTGAAALASAVGGAALLLLQTQEGRQKRSDGKEPHANGRSSAMMTRSACQSMRWRRMAESAHTRTKNEETAGMDN